MSIIREPHLHPFHPPLHGDHDGGDLPVSAHIGSRLSSAGQRHRANDNTSAYALDGEADALRREVLSLLSETNG